MKVATLLNILVLVGLNQAKPIQSRGIQWSPCADLPQEIPCDTCECSTLPVPLDYTNSSSTTIDLPILRIPATEQPSKGSVLFNFGGPGAEARQILASSEKKLMAATGNVYDLVAFDPRGTGINNPMNCTGGDPLELLAIAKGFTLNPDTAPSQNWAQSKVLADRCLRNQSDIGEFIGTAFVARDLMSVVDELDDDGMLRFWGFSYGTVLGATVAAMFPDRIDRIVLDAVTNLHEYYNDWADYEEWLQTDEVFSGIWSTCIDAGPDRCPLAAVYNDSATLEAAVYDLIDSTLEAPIIITSSNATVALDYHNLKQMYSSSIYGPASWPATATITALLLANETESDELYTLLAAIGLDCISPLNPIIAWATTIATIGIRGSDRVLRAESLSQMEPILARLRQQSRILGDISDFLILGGASWRFEAKERYTGPWENITTQHPMLLLGNTWDGYTPIKSAYNTSASFVDSVVLEVEAYGHGTLGVASECLMQKTQAYWVNGTLPEPGEKCGIDVKPYDPVDE